MTTRFNDLENGSSVLTLLGFSSSVSCNLRYQRVGKSVSLTFEAFTGTKAVAGAISVSSGSIASRYCPPENSFFPVNISIDGVRRTAVIWVLSNGAVALYGDASGAQIANGATVSVDNMSISFVL